MIAAFAAGLVALPLAPAPAAPGHWAYIRAARGFRAAYKKGDARVVAVAVQGYWAFSFADLPDPPVAPAVTPFAIGCITIVSGNFGQFHCVGGFGEGEETDFEVTVDPLLESGSMKGEIEDGEITITADVRVAADRVADPYEPSDDPDASFTIRRDLQAVSAGGTILTRPGTQAGKVRFGPFGKFSKRSGRAQFSQSAEAFVCRFGSDAALLSCALLLF